MGGGKGREPINIYTVDEQEVKKGSATPSGQKAIDAHIGKTR